MGQNNKIGKSSYIKITTELSEKEKLRMHYEAVTNNEIKVNRKQEQRLFIYQVFFVIVIVVLAFIKERFFPSDIGWVQSIMQKF